MPVPLSPGRASHQEAPQGGESLTLGDPPRAAGRVGGGGRWGRGGGPGTGGGRWPPRVENPGPQSSYLFRSTFPQQLRESHFNSVLQLLQAMTGNKCASQGQVDDRAVISNSRQEERVRSQGEAR